MIDTLVVVATHNGADALKRFFSVEQLYPTLVVDTGSGMKFPKAGFGQSLTTTTPFKGYETGAWLWAYWNYPARNYLFLQDSVEPKRADYVEPFKELMPGPIGVVAWSDFPPTIWDGEPQRSSIFWMYGKVTVNGIFGQMFYTSRETLDHLALQGLLPMPPTHKEWAQGMERAWAICFARAGVPVKVVAPGHDRRAMEAGEYPVFRKIFRGRT